MYSFDSTVRYSETDEKGRLSLTAMIDYLQDCSTFQSENLGVGLDYLKNENRGWFLAAWMIEIISLPRFTDRIRISTWAYDFKGIYGYRSFTICSPDGEVYVRADSLWFLFDTLLSCPVRLAEKETAPYLAQAGTRLDMPAMERKIRIEGEGRKTESITGMKHHLDTNHHVNNAQYVAMAREAVAEDFKISRLDAQYVKAAVLGDVICPSVHRVPEGFIVELLSLTGDPYAVIKMWKLGG